MVFQRQFNLHWHMMDYHQENNLYAIICANSVREPSLCSFLPVLKIFAKCAVCLSNLNDETVFEVCPISLKLAIHLIFHV